MNARRSFTQETSVRSEATARAITGYAAAAMGVPCTSSASSACSSAPAVEATIAKSARPMNAAQGVARADHRGAGNRLRVELQDRELVIECRQVLVRLVDEYRPQRTRERDVADDEIVRLGGGLGDRGKGFLRGRCLARFHHRIHDRIRHERQDRGCMRRVDHGNVDDVDRFRFHDVAGDRRVVRDDRRVGIVSTKAQLG